MYLLSPKPPRQRRITAISPKFGPNSQSVVAFTRVATSSPALLTVFILTSV